MTSTPMTNLAAPRRPQPLITPAVWVWLGVLTALFVWMHWEFVYRTYRVSKDPNWSHVIIIPLISIYFINQHKARLQAAPKRLFWWALPFVFFGLYAYLWGIYPGRNDMMRGYSMIITIFATALFLLGPSAMRVLWFPILYLGFAVKISDAIWEQIANRLQDIAADGATWVLALISKFMDFTVKSDGNTIYLTFWKDGFDVTEPMNVAEACAGLRMLMAFIALGVALAFLFDRAWWQRLVMVSLAIPIAVAINIGRVTAIGVIYTIDKSYAQGDFHIFVGLLMLIPAAGLFLLVGWLMELVNVRRRKAEAESQIWNPSPVMPAADGAAPPAMLPTIGKGLILGVVLTLCSGLTYAMLINSFSANPIVEDIPRGASMGLLALGAVAFVGIFGLIVKLAPGRVGPAALTFGTAVSVGVLGTSAAGLQTVLEWQQIVLHKEEVPLRHELTRLPLEKGNYVFVEDQVLPEEIIDELGTEMYLSRTYEDLSVPRGEPGRYVRVHVAYYTGLVDTVPHVPDRCFVAGGAGHKGLHDQVISIAPDVAKPREGGEGYVATANLTPPGEPAYAPGTVVKLPQSDISTVRFTYNDGQTPGDQHVSYFFAANGKFLASPNEVRLQGFDLRDTHSYYCKIEVLIHGESDPQRVAERTTAVLNEFLPDILACLPDWEDVKAGDWPVDPDAGTAP